MSDSASPAQPSGDAKKKRDESSRGFFGRIVLFVRQVIGELRKVVTPTRSEMVTFTAVVIVFVIVIMAYVGALDFGFGLLVQWVFGN